jgi:hypothetical protein
VEKIMRNEASNLETKTTSSREITPDELDKIAGGFYGVGLVAMEYYLLTARDCLLNDRC